MHEEGWGTSWAIAADCMPTMLPRVEVEMDVWKVSGGDTKGDWSG